MHACIALHKAIIHLLAILSAFGLLLQKLFMWRIKLTATFRLSVENINLCFFAFLTTLFFASCLSFEKSESHDYQYSPHPSIKSPASETL
jgi:hypothetical protein